MSTPPVIHRELETAAYRANRKHCRDKSPDVLFASHFLSRASRHSLFCVLGVVEQMREIMADGKDAAPAAQGADPQPASCGSGGCGSCSGAESPEKRRDVCFAVLDHLYSGEPTGKAELDGFHTVAARQQIGREWLERFVHGLYSWQTTKRCATWTKLRQLCDDTGGAGAIIAFKAMLPPSAGAELTQKSQSLILAWGAAMRLAWSLERIGVDKRAGRQLLPMDDLVKFGVLESSLQSWAAAGASGGDTKWKQLLEFETTRAENLYRGGCGALTMLGAGDQKALAVWGERWMESLAALRSGARDGLAEPSKKSDSFWKQLGRVPRAVRRLDEKQHT